MKLYTRPRPLTVGQLRPGDHVALRPDGEPICRDTEYIDEELRGKLRWTIVAHLDLMSPEGHPSYWVVHARGRFGAPAVRPVIIREAIELDPWTYVQRAQPAEPQPE